MQLELVSYPLCPYAQRTIITLRHKAVEFTLTPIDLESRPDWFDRLSPLGKVPILRVAGERTLFESTVICELVDELHPPRMLALDPIDRAWERGWIAHTATLLGALYRLFTAADEPTYASACHRLCDALEPMERQLEPEPLFGGATLTLLDASIAPFFQRLEIYDSVVPVAGWADFPRMRAWSRALGALPVVQGSVAPDFRARLLAKARAEQGVLARALESSGATVSAARVGDAGGRPDA